MPEKRYFDLQLDSLRAFAEGGERAANLRSPAMAAREPGRSRPDGLMFALHAGLHRRTTPAEDA